jgi:hypothetical protein
MSNKTIKTMGYKLTVPITDVLEIHGMACNVWKSRIKVNYLNRIDEFQNITFTENEIDEMFEAALVMQIPTLTKIFGEKKKPVDFDRLKTGSKVMIDYTGEHCTGIDSVDLNESFDIVFYKTKHFIDSSNNFRRESRYSSYITFHQNGKYVLFSSEKNADYIVDVIEY